MSDPRITHVAVERRPPPARGSELWAKWSDGAVTHWWALSKEASPQFGGRWMAGDPPTNLTWAPVGEETIRAR